MTGTTLFYIRGKLALHMIYDMSIKNTFDISISIGLTAVCLRREKFHWRFLPKKKTLHNEFA